MAFLMSFSAPAASPVEKSARAWKRYPSGEFGSMRISASLASVSKGVLSVALGKGGESALGLDGVGTQTAGGAPFSFRLSPVGKSGVGDAKLVMRHGGIGRIFHNAGQKIHGILRLTLLVENLAAQHLRVGILRSGLARTDR